MILVKENSVVMLSTSVSTSSRMLSVLAYASVTGTDVTALFPVLMQPCHTSGKSVTQTMIESELNLPNSK